MIGPRRVRLDSVDQRSLPERLNLSIDLGQFARRRVASRGRDGGVDERIGETLPLLLELLNPVEKVVASSGARCPTRSGQACRLSKPSTRFARAQRPASIESSAVTFAPRARLTPAEMTSSSPSAKT